MKTLLPLALLVALLPAAAVPAAPDPAPRVPLRWDRFYDVAEVEAALRALAEAHPGWLALESIGRSVEGRDILLATLADPAGPPPSERPAMYIEANVHGNEVQGTEACLYTLWYALENRERLAPLADLLRRVTLYVAPCVNPDGRHRWFSGQGSAESPRSGARPQDEDLDGLADEDGPDDLDGDGSITLMRKRVASGGEFRSDPDDPRRMRRAEPGQVGDFVLLGSEGLDNDGDGEVNEDGPGGYDMNRNFPGDWRPEHQQYGAGPYPLCFPETRAVAGFLLARPNVSALQSYHTTGGMILRGPGHPDAEPWPDPDLRVFDELGRTGERMLPHYRYLCLVKDLYTAYGSLVSYAYEALGIFAFTNELWAEEQYEGRSADHGDEVRAMRGRFADDLEFGAPYAEWKPYRHPVYGDIEIGGPRRTLGRAPPPFMLQELCHRNMAFTLYHADEMPLLEAAPPEVEPLPGGLLRVRAEVRNDRLLPTRAVMAARHGLGRPDLFEIEVRGGKVVSGGLLAGAPLRERAAPQEREPARLRVEGGVPSRGRVRAEWIVAPDGPEVTFDIAYRSEKGGTVLATGKGGKQ